MWEVRAAEGQLDALRQYVLTHVDPSADVYVSADPDPRLVVIDPSQHGVPDVPAELIARPPHAWTFDRVERRAAE
jgi:hypothetical protein